MKFEQTDIQQKVLSCLSDGRQVFRKVLIREVLALFPLSEDDLTDTRPDSVLNRLMSNIGSAITKLLNDGDLVLSEGKKLSLTRLKTIIVDENKIENFVLSAFGAQCNLLKEELFKRAERHFKTSKTDTLADDDALRVGLDNVLNKLLDSGVLGHSAGAYYPMAPSHPLSPIGVCLNEARKTGNVEQCLINAINIMGGEFFEVYCVKLLEEYFRLSGYRVLKARVTGGSRDNGIDGILNVRSPLGFVESVYIQCKARKTAEVTLNEVRQFAGAFYGERATKGIFITNNSFHPDVYEFFGKVKSSVIGIDREKLLDLAKECSVGIIMDGNRRVLDESLFLQTYKTSTGRRR